MYQVHRDHEYGIACCSPSAEHKIETLKEANYALQLPCVCLSRIREPLGHLGGYWSMDPDIVFNVTTGQLPAVIRAIECMRVFFTAACDTKRVSQETKHDMRVFIDRASAWVRANRFDTSYTRYELCENGGGDCDLSSLHYDLA
ncbi:hypothetical protein IWW50_003403 [Coemansia erecta]|nr:hypothetical protein GGF43_006703 [Coemansia sp. RSA 2618]KAJ2824288.1 hypothetical protein IWW50_003403 [Coemansia erecta]